MRRMLLAATLAAALPAVAASPGRAHWKSEMTGSALPTPVKVESWVKDGRQRTVTTTPVGTSTIIVKDGTAWIRSGPLAMKMPVSRHRSATPQPVDYVQDLDALLASGKRLGTESLDGESCETWKVVLTRDEGKVESVLWISPSLRFPRQVTVKAERGDVRIRNHAIDLAGAIDDALFTPDTGIAWQDLGDVLRQLQATPSAPSRAMTPSKPLTQSTQSTQSTPSVPPPSATGASPAPSPAPAVRTPVP